MTPAEVEALTQKLTAICHLAEAAASLYADSMNGMIMPTITKWNALRDAIEAVGP